MVKSDIIKTEEFVREPVDKEVKNILNSSKERIIITGGKGVEKSVVLLGLEHRIPLINLESVNPNLFCFYRI